MVNLDQIAERCESTLKDSVFNNHYYLLLGLTSEVGEVVDLYKKTIRDSDGHWSKEKERELMLEIGDCFYYLLVLCRKWRVSPEEILEMNWEKLSKRHHKLLENRKDSFNASSDSV